MILTSASVGFLGNVFQFYRLFKVSKPLGDMNLDYETNFSISALSRKSTKGNAAAKYLSE